MLRYFLLLIACGGVFAEEVVKVSFGDLAATETGDFTMLEYSEYAQVLQASSYVMGEIQRVEHYDGTYVSLAAGDKGPIVVNEGKIGFIEEQKDLALSLPTELPLTVSLYTNDGENIAVLFCGVAEEGILHLGIGERPIASGAYTVVVKTEAALFMRSVLIR